MRCWNVMAGLAARTLLRFKPRFVTQMVAFRVTSRERAWNQSMTERRSLVDPCPRRVLSSFSRHMCWKCGTKNEDTDLFCAYCRALQKPNKDISYFRLFGLQPSFDLNPNSLTKRFREMQSILHPDKYANSSEEEKTISEEYSSIVNKAYSTLQHPLSRGFYLLKLYGIYLEEGNVQSDPIFLMELMERNEEVDDANNSTKIKAVIERNKRALDTLKREASEAFKNGDLQGAKNALTKMKYFSSIEAKIKILKAERGYMD